MPQISTIARKQSRRAGPKNAPTCVYHVIGFLGAPPAVRGDQVDIIKPTYPMHTQAFPTVQRC